MDSCANFRECPFQGCTKLKSAWGLNFNINFRPDFHAILMLSGKAQNVHFILSNTYIGLKMRTVFFFNHTETNKKIIFWWSLWTMALINCKGIETRRSENDNTPQPLDQWTNSPFMGQQVGNCKSFTLTHYLAELFAMHYDPRASPSWIGHCIQLASLLFQVDQPSHS